MSSTSSSRSHRSSSRRSPYSRGSIESISRSTDEFFGSGDSNRSSHSKSSYSYHTPIGSSSNTSSFHPTEDEDSRLVRIGDSPVQRSSTVRRVFGEDAGYVNRPNRERKFFISGPKNYFRGDVNRVLKNSLFKDTVKIDATRPKEKFYKIKEPKESERTLKQRQLDREEEEKIDMEIEVEAEEINHKSFFKYQLTIRCECYFPHPDYWSEQMIAEVHRNFHKIKCNDLKAPEELVIFKNDKATVIRLRMCENTIWTNKALQALEFIDIELGYSGITMKNSLDVQVFLMLRKQFIIGCVVAGKAQHGYRLVSKLEDAPMVSSTPEPILCAINRIWVLPKYRRRKIASFMLSYTRNFYMPEPLDKEYIGFSDPSSLGRLFIASYIGRSDFKVYLP